MMKDYLYQVSNASMKLTSVDVHQDRGTLGLEVSHGLKRFYEPDFIVNKV